jgi:hypothetical protein
MINDPIEEYKSLTAICAKTDYAKKSSLRKHNKAVARMYEIAESIGHEKAKASIDKFAALLDIADNKTNLWAAIHLLERIPVINEIENKALAVVESASTENNANSIGYQIWLKEWKQNRKNKTSL